MSRRALPMAMATVVVLAVYVFFGSAGTWAFRRVPWYQQPKLNGNHYYASLAEGFRTGHLSMAHAPEPRLVAMPNPYNVHERVRLGIDYLWDASLYQGRYYLYFTPLPALIFYLPFRIFGNAYPPDTLAAVVFSGWAFVMSVLFARRALAGRKLHLPMWLWTLLIGLGNIIPFQMSEVRTYEVAILCGTATSATWAWSLLRFLETGSRKRAAWMGFWLAMTITARPNLIVLLPFAALALLRKPAPSAEEPEEPRGTPRNCILAAFIPLAIIGLTVMSYNFARFRNPFEFGVRYQLTFVDMKDHRVCSVCSTAEVVRVINSANHYVFAGPAIGSDFPFVDPARARLDPVVTFPLAGPENVIGIAPLVPLTVVASLIALIFALMRKRRFEESTRAATLLMGGAWLALFGLSACWWVTARYALDFMLLMVAATAVLIERGLTMLQENDVEVRPLRAICALLAVYSIVISIAVAFMGPNAYFREHNPELFDKLQKRFRKDDQRPATSADINPPRPARPCATIPNAC